MSVETALTFIILNDAVTFFSFNVFYSFDVFIKSILILWFYMMLIV